jgi:hypothetical protein
MPPDALSCHFVGVADRQLSLSDRETRRRL